MTVHMPNQSCRKKTSESLKHMDQWKSKVYKCFKKIQQEKRKNNNNFIILIRLVNFVMLTKSFYFFQNLLTYLRFLFFLLSNTFINYNTHFVTVHFEQRMWRTISVVLMETAETLQLFFQSFLNIVICV